VLSVSHLTGGLGLVVVGRRFYSFMTWSVAFGFLLVGVGWTNLDILQE